jgi:hypothetical protein
VVSGCRHAGRAHSAHPGISKLLGCHSSVTVLDRSTCNID